MYPSSDIDMYSTDADISTSCGLDCLLDISMDGSRVGEVVALEPLGLRIALAGEHPVVDAGPAPSPIGCSVLTLGSATNPSRDMDISR
jgi:hypothetical protein